MEKFIIPKANSRGIPCIAEFPEGCSKIVIIIHGFLSSKESDNAAYMMKYFSEKGMGAIAYDQPGHGTEEAADERLILSSCLDSLRTVERYLSAKYPGAEICYFGSSFGGYVLGIYLSRKLNSGHKAFMRCGAVIFPEMILGDVHAEPDPDVMKILDTQGYIETVIDGQHARFSKEFLEELRANSMVEIYDKAKPQNVEIAFVHGEKDPVVPLAEVKAFAEKHGYPISVVPEEGHSISSSPESPGIVAAKAYELFMG